MCLCILINLLKIGREVNFIIAFRQIIFPRLFLFKPSLIFISSGFDAHESEIISHPFSCLNEYDYKWITEELVKIANKFSNSRISISN